MVSIQGKTALVTGASSGIGRCTVELLLKYGVTVFAAARRTEDMRELEQQGAHVLHMDITDEKSVVERVSAITAESGSIDILINNAGYGSYGAIEEVPLSEARRQFEVNLFGLARLTQLVLPVMRQNHYGKIVNVSSMGGRIFTPFGGWYHATKHALEGWSDCLRLETKPFGIDVIIIEPGGIKTPWGIIAADNLKKVSGSGPYAKQALPASNKTRKLYSGPHLTDPSVIATVIVKSLTAKKPKRRYVKGFGAAPALFVRKWLGDAIFEKLISASM